MKITELLKLCDTLFPNEFTEDEKLVWCDELGAIICREHARHRQIMTAEQVGGRYALPQGVAISEIDRIIINDTMIKKSDAPGCGVLLYEDGGRVFAAGDAINSATKFLVRQRYEGIRKISLFGAKIVSEKGTITIPFCPIKKDDKLWIEAGSESYLVTAGEVTKNADNTITFKIAGGTIPEGSLCGDIKRVITDETVCSKPFDAMYCDFLGAKICFYQRDYDSYNHHMALFNSRLEDYDRYIIQTSPLPKDSRVSNWWN